MTVRDAFKSKVRADMLYYENLLKQATEQQNERISERIKIILSQLYNQITSLENV